MADQSITKLPFAGKAVEIENLPIFTADPATFLVATAVLTRVRESVSEMRKWLGERPDLEIVLDRVLAGMKRAGTINIIGDRILVLSETLSLDLGNDKVAASLREVVMSVMKSVHANMKVDPKGCFPDALAFATLPDHPKVKRRIAEIHTRFKAEVNQLDKEIEGDPEITGEQTRFVMLLNGPMRPEDF